MLEFNATSYTDNDGKTFWQPQLPDGTFLFYDTVGTLVYATIEEADKRDLRPAVSETYKDAIKTAQRVWKSLIKDRRKSYLNAIIERKVQ